MFMIVDEAEVIQPEMDEENHRDAPNVRDVRLNRNNDSDADASFISEPGSVSCLHRCQSEEAKRLCIFDLTQKLKHSCDYDIGGTYTRNEPDLWFFYSTSICPGYNYLVNLFVCHRKIGSFSIGVSNSNVLADSDKIKDFIGTATLPQTLVWYTFKSAQPNEIYHIKTFCFNESGVKSLGRGALIIPTTIMMNSSNCLNNDVIMSIKLHHDLSGLLSKKEKTDYILTSASGKKFPTHKIILVAHSPNLRNLIKDSESDSLFIDIQDHDMDLLLQFLYTGTIKDIIKQNCINLLKIADKFQLENLFLLTQYAIGEQINVENAINIAVIARKYNLGKLQLKVFSFIKDNPKVMQTESWEKLQDVELTKKLLEHIYAKE